jgi:hypothetical protein
MNPPIGEITTDASVASTLATSLVNIDQTATIVTTASRALCARLGEDALHFLE